MSNNIDVQCPILLQRRNNAPINVKREGGGGGRAIIGDLNFKQNLLSNTPISDASAFQIVPKFPYTGNYFSSNIPTHGQNKPFVYKQSNMLKITLQVYL